jgi:hypothetical protein
MIEGLMVLAGKLKKKVAQSAGAGWAELRTFHDQP